MKKYLVYTDILGFKKLAEEIARRSQLHEDWVRENMLTNPMTKAIGKLQDNIQKSSAVSSIEGSDNYIIATDTLETAFEVIRKVTTVKLPVSYINHVPVEIVIGVKEIDDIDIELRNRKEIIDFLKGDIITPYRNYQKKKGNGVKETFILLTEDAARELNAEAFKHCKKMTVGEKSFYVAEPVILRDARATVSELAAPLLELLLRGNIGQFNKRRKKVKPELIDLRGVDLRGLNLRKVDFSGMYLIGTNLEGADLSAANLSDSKLMGAKLGKTKLVRSNFHRTDLEAASLLDADLSYCQINSADFTRANLSGAQLHNAGLFYSSFFLSNLSGANLSGSTAKETDFEKANLQDANLTEVFFNRVDISEADLRRANLSKAQIGFSFMNESDLREADLSGAYLSETDLTKADLRGIIQDKQSKFPYRAYRGVKLDKSTRKQLEDRRQKSYSRKN